jgi:hypothetical protein
VERLRARTPSEEQKQAEALLGLAAVRAEAVAEDLRTRLDAQRVPPMP